MPDASLPSPERVVHMPHMCPRHQRAVVDLLNIPESGPWEMAIVTVNLACFRATSCDERFLKRTGDDVAAFSLVLAEIGCLACFQGRAFDLAIKIMALDGNHHGLFAVAYGKAPHPMWPAEWTVPPKAGEVTNG